MDWLDILALMLLAAVIWLWLDSLKAREIAVAEARTACDAEGLLLLDDTVTIQRLGFGRDDGALCVRRIYGFEYSDSGNDRWAGNLVMLGARALVVNLARPGSVQSVDMSGGPWLH